MRRSCSRSPRCSRRLSTSSLQPFSSEDPGSQSVAARRAIERATGVDPYFNLIALVPAPEGLASLATRREVARVERALAAEQTVAAVHSYYANRTPGLAALNGRSTLVVGQLRALPIATELAGARRVERRLSSLRGVELGGLAAFYAQGNDTARGDLVTAELFAFPLLLLISVWVFRSLVAAMLPLLIGAVTIVCTLAALRIASEITNVSIYALNIATALGLGPVGRLQPSDRVALPRGDGARRANRGGTHGDAQIRWADRRDLVGHSRRRAELAARVPAAVPEIDRPRRHPRCGDCGHQRRSRSCRRSSASCDGA